MRFVWAGENAIRPQTDPTAKRTAHFWTKPAAVVSCAVHYGMRKCLLTVCSVAWQVADKLGVVGRGVANPPAQLSLHNNSVLSAAFYSRLCLLLGARMEFSRTHFLTNRRAVKGMCSKIHLANKWSECCHVIVFWFVSAGSDQIKQCGVKKNQNGKK